MLRGRLDYWILSQNCRNILPKHTVAQLVSAQNEALLWLAGMNYVKIRTHWKAKHLLGEYGETRTRSKINHVLAGLGPPGSKCVG